MELEQVKGTTYSVTDYQNYNENGDLNYFEEVIDAMILDGISGMNDSFRNAIMSLDRDKKRMTILSLLDKDLNLFKRIKALTDKNIGKMDHIKDIILMLREYVKVGEVEKKKFGEVMTPLELVKEMLATLPEEVWSNPNLKWLDPANGTGPYPIMVIYKLMNGLKDYPGLEDDEVRYKHIVENMIYVCELQPKNMFLYMCAVDPFDSYKLNIFTGSFLEEGFDFHMKNVWGLDGFDVVIGNPPYQAANNKSNKLWVKFTKKVFELSNSVCFVVPISLMISESNQITEIRTIMSKKNNQFNLTKTDIFNVGEKVVFFTSFNSDDIITKIIFNDGQSIISSVDIIKRLPVEKNDNIKISILKKIESYIDKNDYVYDFYHGSNQTTPNRLFNKGYISYEEDEIFKYKVHHSASKILYSKVLDNEYAKDKTTTYGKLKVVLNYSGGFIGDKYMFLSTNLIGKQMVGILVDNENIGKNIINTYSSNLFNWYITNEKSGGFNTGVFKLPKLDFSKSWKDYELYEYFHLTQEEIDLIEKNNDI